MRRKPWSHWTSLFATNLQRPNTRRDGVRLHLQALEDRLALTTLPTGFTETLVTSGLSSPTAMEFSPVGELWILQQSGGIRMLLADGTVVGTASLSVNSVGERGLLGIAFDSNYDGAGPHTDYVYLYYTDPAGPSGDAINNRLSRFSVAGAGTGTVTITPASEVILRDLPPNTEDTDSNHNGGAIHFGPDGKLYVAVGDHNYDGVTQAAHVSQINTTPFGKILRLNADGTNPTDNPYYDAELPNPATNWEGSIWAKGLRNPYTFAIEPDTGMIFINDVGEGQWEEINLGEATANYGWAGSPAPVWEGFENDGTPPPFANYRDPLMAYDHSNGGVTPAAGVAITGGAFYPHNSQFGANYGGLYFYADYSANFIRVFDPDNPGTLAVPDTSTGFATNPSTFGPVDLKVDAAGNLYYLAIGGAAYRISFTGNYGPTQVAARQIFYNNSKYDGKTPAAGASDDGAIATEKSAYLPGGGTITAGSVTSYSRGINGIMIDLSGNHGSLDAGDFTFRVSGTGLDANNTPSSWSTAPAPANVLVRAGAGVGGADRVEIVWADGAIRNAYLEVIVEGNDAAGGFNTNTGLAASDVFFFGNKIGDDFDATSGANFNTNSTDQVDARDHFTIFGVTKDNIYDFDRNGLINSTDQVTARDNFGLLTRINISSPPAAPEVVPTKATAEDPSAVALGLTMPMLARSIQQPVQVFFPGPRVDGSDGSTTSGSLPPAAVDLVHAHLTETGSDEIAEFLLEWQDELFDRSPFDAAAHARARLPRGLPAW